MTLPDKSRDVIGKSQEIWNWIAHRMVAADNSVATIFLSAKIMKFIRLPNFYSCNTCREFKSPQVF